MMTESSLEGVQWKYDLLAIVLCATALIVALSLAYFRQVAGLDVETDFYEMYAVAAENLLAGRPYTFIHNGPGYILLLAAVTSVTGDAFAAGKIISAVATALFAWFNYSLLKSLFDSRIAFASTFLLLVALLQYSFQATMDVVGALAMILPSWILLCNPVLTLPMCFVAGVLSGVAYLVRYNAIFVSVGLGLTILFVKPQDNWQDRRIQFAVFFSGVLLAVAPWLWFNARNNGGPFVATAHLQSAAHFYYPTGDKWHAQAFKDLAPHFHSFLDVVLHDPLKFVRVYVSNTLYNNITLLCITVLTFPVSILAGNGLLLLLKDLDRRRFSFLFVSILGYFLLGLVGLSFRYYIFFFPVLILPVTYLLFQRRVLRRLGYLRYRKIAVSWLILFIIGGLMGFEGVYRTAKMLVYEPRYFFESADFLERYSAPSDIVLVYKPHIAYLAGRKKLFPLGRSAEEILEIARETGARFIVYSKHDALFWPPLASLRDPAAVPTALKMVYRQQRSDTIIYEVAN